MKHRFPHLWTLRDAQFTKNKGTVFSCFSGGGGSTLGYKLAGFDVIGCNEIDPRMMRAYVANNAPKYAYTEPIQTFKARQDLPPELYHLDILDGSPPCSTFSIAGKREKDWGKARKFTEGQAEQVLDTLFFDFIELAGRLQPKVIVAENVKGIMMGPARAYYIRILSEMEAAGYNAPGGAVGCVPNGCPPTPGAGVFPWPPQRLGRAATPDSGFVHQRAQDRHGVQRAAD
jgi:DNA (cytosine-5)-methyltransferase 1